MQVNRFGRCFLSLLLSVIAFALGSLPAHAQVQQSKGKATVQYVGKAAPPDVKAKALQTAQLKAIEGYYAEAGESESANFDAMRDKIAGDIDRYVLDSTVLSEEDNVAGQSYTVAVRVSLNVARLRNALKANSTVAQTGRSGKSSLAFVFVSRQVDSQKEYDARVYKRSEATADGAATASAKKEGVEGEAVKKGQVATSESVSSQQKVQATVTASVETGGSVTRKASETTWRLIPSANLNQVFTQTFATAGFRVQEAAFVEEAAQGQFTVAAVENDYRSGNDLKSATLQSIARGMRTAGVPYVSLGTLDVGLPEKDPQTGLIRVGVTVNARLFDMSQPLVETVASVGPVQYSGRGPSEDEARTNALKLAASSAARELSSQANSQGIR